MITQYAPGGIIAKDDNNGAFVLPPSETLHPADEIVSAEGLINSIHSGIPGAGRYMNSLMSSVRFLYPAVMMVEAILLDVSSSPVH